MMARDGSSREIADSIESRIVTWTHGRIRDLRVELSGGAIVLRGRAASQHIKQLALHGVLDIQPGRRIVNAIHVTR